MRQKLDALLKGVVGIAVIIVTVSVSAILASQPALADEQVGALWVPPGSIITPLYAGVDQLPVGYVVDMGDRQTSCTQIKDDSAYACVTVTLRR